MTIKLSLLNPAPNGDTIVIEHSILRRWAEARRQMLLTELQQMTMRRAALLKELGAIEDGFGFERSVGARER